MTTADIYDPRLRPGRRVLMQLIAVKSAGIYNRRAERLFMRGLERTWKTDVLERLLGRLLAHAEAIEESLLKEAFDRRKWSRSRNSLARAKGWGLAGQVGVDDANACPVGHDTKTPAAGPQESRIAAAAMDCGDDSAWGTSQRTEGGCVV